MVMCLDILQIDVVCGVCVCGCVCGWVGGCVCGWVWGSIVVRALD
jgi:hypothetical protein